MSRDFHSGVTLGLCIVYRYNRLPYTSYFHHMDLKLYVDKPPSRIDVLKKWMLRAVVALLFICVGSNKFAARSPWIQIFAQIGFGQWFRYFTGVLQIAGGLLVLIPR